MAVKPIEDEAAKENAKLTEELADKDKQLTEARAEIEHWKSECNALQRMVHEARAEIERKDKLIEQMREALRAWVRTPNISLHEAIKLTEAALGAAEKRDNYAG